MNIRPFLAFALVLLGLATQAQPYPYQPFARDSALWLYQHYQQFDNSHNYFYVYMEGDTLIRKRVYKKMYIGPESNHIVEVMTPKEVRRKFRETQGAFPYIGAFRDDTATRKVYLAPKQMKDDTEKVVFDFSSSEANPQLIFHCMEGANHYVIANDTKTEVSPKVIDTVRLCDGSLATRLGFVVENSVEEIESIGVLPFASYIFHNCGCFECVDHDRLQAYWRGDSLM